MAAGQRWAKSWKLRQTYIGRTAEKTLTIHDRHKVPRGEAHIFRLPDELLLMALELVTSNYCFENTTCACEMLFEYKPLTALVVTCRRFHDIVIPLLYRKIRFEYPHRAVPPTEAARALHRTLRNNPSLWQYCQLLWINIEDFLTEAKPEDFSIINDLASWLTNVRCLVIRGGFDGGYSERTWAFVRSAALHMRELQHVSINRAGWGLYLSPILQNVDTPTLRRLEISGVSEAKNSASSILDPKKHRTSPITRLTLTDYEESPEATAQLLQWPAQLTHFSFGSIYNNRFPMSLSLFHTLLAPHRLTLRSISIGALSPPARRTGDPLPFRASDFPNLHTLRLSRWLMPRTLAFSPADADALLAPQLRLFAWDFTIYDQHSEGWTDFGEAEERWLTGLAGAAIARGAALRRLEVTFRPDSWMTKLEDGYPWDRMDRVARTLRPSGVVLAYSEPTVSKAQWLEEVGGGSGGPERAEARRIPEFFLPVWT